MFLFLAVAGWSLTACKQHFDDWAQPKVYPQEPAIEVSGFTATPTTAAASVIDLGTMAEGSSVKLFDLTIGTLPEGVSLKNIRLEAKPADQPTATATEVDASETGEVTKEELMDLVYNFYGKKSTVRVFDAALYANAAKGTEAQLITLCSFQLKVKPEKLEEPYYYVYGRATAASADNAYKFVMTPVEGNDMAFTYTTKFFGMMDMLIWNMTYWKTDNPNNDFSKVYGQETKGSKAESGTVIQGNKENFFVSPSAKFYTFTVDLEKMTYEWKLLDDQNPASYTNISLIGVNGKWSDGDDIDLTVVDRNKHNWYLRYTFTADTQLKFRANHGWTMNWGYGSNDGDWKANEDWAKFCTPDAKNISITAGTYDIYFCDITGAAHFVPVE